MPPSKWDYRFLDLAQFISQWSKDPSTKVGAVIADMDNRIVSVGFNGLPQRVRDLEERLIDREQKLKMVVHAEMNAILFAHRPLVNCTLYTWPMAPCSNCASFIAQSGVYRVVAPRHNIDSKWKDSIDLAMLTLNEAGILVQLIQMEG